MPDILTPFLSVSQLALVPLVMAIVSVFKATGIVGKYHRYAPTSALVLGVISAFVLPSATVGLTIIAGVSIGCIAAGVYSGVKTTMPNS